MVEMQRRNLVIINDHQFISDLLGELLAKHGLKLIKSFTDAESGLSYVLLNPPDLVIIDMMLPIFRTLKGDKVNVDHPYILMDIQTSLRAVKQICSKCLKTRILMLTGERHPYTFCLGFEAGAHGIVSKLDNSRSFMEVLYQVMAGRKKVTSKRMQGIIEKYETTPRIVLTPLEIQILELAQEGLEAPQIGSKLGYAPKTIRNALSRINTKLGTCNRFETIEMAVEMGLIGWRTGCDES